MQSSKAWTDARFCVHFGVKESYICPPCANDYSKRNLGKWVHVTWILMSMDIIADWTEVVSKRLQVYKKDGNNGATWKSKKKVEVRFENDKDDREYLPQERQG